jgi:hypothetical protein
MVEMWAQEGPKGLDFGYLYDMEVHRGLVEGFHPAGDSRMGQDKDPWRPRLQLPLSHPGTRYRE